ncbi:unnamed protein product [Lepidochelys olivacea]
MPWERRNESKTAKKRRLENEVKQELEKLQQLANEKYSAIDQYLLSGDEKLRVYTVDRNLLNICIENAALTYTGSHLVLSSYSDDEKITYITLWNLETRKVKK